MSKEKDTPVGDASPPATPFGAPGAPSASPPAAPAKKPIFKKWWFWLLVVVAIIVVVNIANGGSKGNNPSSAPSSAPTTDTSTPAPPAATSDYVVIIKGATFGKDYKGKKAIIVEYEFTNNSKEAKSFMFAVSAKAFQGGVELNDPAIGVGGADSSSQMAEIKPGAKITVKEAYILRDETAVLIEVTELFSFNDEILATHQFTVG